MSLIKSNPNPNLWEQICQEFNEERQQILETRELGSTDLDGEFIDFDSTCHHPVFLGKPFAAVWGDFDIKTELDPAIGHPCSAGFWLADDGVLPEKRTPWTESPPLPDPLPDKKKCTNREFLEYYVWPTLLPGLEKTLIQAKHDGCFGLKKVSFNSLDFLTEYLYNHNPRHLDDRGTVPLLQIPFVQLWLATHPRPPRPISLTWTEDETAVKIQRAWRGYLVRRDPEVQELRKWQEEWRFINREGRIQAEVSGFWDKLMPTPTASGTAQNQARSNTSGSKCSSLSTEFTSLGSQDISKVLEPAAYQAFHARTDGSIHSVVSGATGGGATA